MRIKWIKRFQNKATLLGLIGATITFVYQLLGLFGVVAPVSQDTVVQLFSLIINIMVALGVVVDPTTNGLSDSERVLNGE